MGTSGLIYVAIAAAWLAYLIPQLLRRREQADSEQADPSDRFSDSMRIIRTGAAPVVDHEYAVMDVEISTPLTRRTAVRELKRSEQRAAGRRRRTLTVLLLGLSAVLAVCVGEWLPWWSMAIPGGLLVAFVVTARVSVSLMRRDFDERYELITRGSDETTVFLSRKAVAKTLDAVVNEPAEVKPELAGTLWEPLPITMPTYVSKPLAPRTVRTIDLSAPEVLPADRDELPVVAEAPGTGAEPDADQTGLRVVGE